MEVALAACEWTALTFHHVAILSVLNSRQLDRIQLEMLSTHCDTEVANDEVALFIHCSCLLAAAAAGEVLLPFTINILH